MASPQDVAAELAQKYDLTPKLIPNLDRHLVFPLLDFLDNHESFDSAEMVQAKFDLLKSSNMTDFVGQLYMSINNTDVVPEEFGKKKDAVLENLRSLEARSEKILGLLDDAEVVSNLRSDKLQNMKYLEENHQITHEMIDVLFEFGQQQFSCGNYAAASDLLYQFRILSTDSEKTAQATWGKLACDILRTEWESAMEEVTKVKDLIEQKLYNNPVAQLQHRSWLIHWALFPFFNYDAARETLIELFFSPAFINTIQTACPWILRYLAAAVITNRNRNRNAGQYQKQLKDLVRVVKQEHYEYQDPITEFVTALRIDYDFEEAQRKLSEAEEVLKSDFFLVATAATFVDSARHLISESYCQIHQRIDIKDLAKRLNLSQDEGEKWIVNLIRDTRVDAKIDYKEGTVVMNHPPQSVYQQVIERTKGGFFRTQVISAAVSKA
ncbi:putative eukaryotic translation initiation factor 3 subunit EifCe [Pyronema domesticum]|uniref:Eukaryotic translation initiation factor 3 subunit E n=1 Tax=Pyronema omphalodes (strain CBS 100304) TaxID=1076935 RepID=U4L2B0_PYROM|nr:putative eukaryotic translation initiation factor 3 subunit EifCe [Pyronema domesticum]CCX09811.1 Similar to eukaryotic translation initiation factor 3 subunit EifCe, putative [Penicillium marneffei ATCC 18224]; acc. no. XP_002143536 [Pyronema omphalodes CBS 100304]